MPIEPLEPRRLLAAVILDPLFATDGVAKDPFPFNSVVGMWGNSAGGYDLAMFYAGSDHPQTTHLGIGRLTVDGVVDRSFAKRGKAMHPFPDVDSIQGAVRQPDGKIVVLAMERDLETPSDDIAHVIRFNPDGGLDLTFGSGGSVAFVNKQSYQFAKWALAIAPDGGIICCTAAIPNPRLVRVTKTGQLDKSFGVTGTADLPIDIIDFRSVQLAVDSNNRIIAGVEGEGGGLVARFTASGKLDSTFASGGVSQWQAQVTAIALAANDQIYVAGHLFGTKKVWLLGTDGNVDEKLGGFDGASIHIPSPEIRGLRAMPDGRLVVLCQANTGTHTNPSFIRLKSNGQLDLTFDDDAVAEFSEQQVPSVGDFTVHPKGRITMFGGGIGVARTGARPEFGVSAVGTIFITTFDGNDSITVKPASNGVRVSINGIVSTIASRIALKLDVITGGGHDFIANYVDIPCVIDAGSGNNRIATAGGADTISSGGGRDTVSGGAGNDNIFTKAGNDRISGGPGDDTLIGGSGADVLSGGDGNDFAQLDPDDEADEIENVL